VRKSGEMVIHNYLFTSLSFNIMLKN